MAKANDEETRESVIDEAAPGEAVRLLMLPRPCEVLGRGEAIRWLLEDYPAFNNVAVRVLIDGKAKPLRWGGFLLAEDLQDVVVACGKAISAGGEIRFAEHVYWNSPQHATELLETLAELTTSQHIFDGGSGPFEWAYEELGKELVRRLKLARG
jgi:hypothetical protein